MKIQLLSDTHWEYLGDEYDLPDIEPTNADVIVLAGDIHNGYLGIIWAAKQMERLNTPVIYVAGNHEYYTFDIDSLHRDLKKVAKIYGVHYLQNDSIVIDGVRFLGSTLWTNYGKGHPGLMQSAQMRVNDHRYIFDKKWWSTKAGKKTGERWLESFGLTEKSKERFLPHAAYSKHKQAIRWLKKALDTHHDGKTVIVTHHAPLYNSIQSLIQKDTLLNPEYWYPDPRDRLNLYRIASYASDLSELIQTHHKNINLWLHGHVHWVQDYATKGIRFSANPRGYPLVSVPENERYIYCRDGQDTTSILDPTQGTLFQFKPDWVIDLDDGIKPALWPQCERLAQKWEEPYQQAIALKPYAHSKDAIIADLAARHMEALADAFNQATRKLLQPVLSNLNPTLNDLAEYKGESKCENKNEDKEIEPIPSYFEQYPTPDKTVYVDASYSPAFNELKNSTYTSKSYYDSALKRMENVKQQLMKWISDELTTHQEQTK